MKSIVERMTIPELIVYVSKFMFEHDLTDIAGGNISIKNGDTVYMTPTLAGNKWHWDIGSDDIIIGSMNQLDTLKQHPRFTREGLSHLAIYKAFSYVGAVIHAHPKYINPFVAQSKPIQPMLNASKQFGELQYHTEAPQYSQEQADKIVDVLKGQEERMKKKAAGVLMPRHGIIVVSADLMTALDCVQRMNNNAYTVLAQKLLD
jgi:ribulose-5-phosphate 4-epimerase/fuculose-1-phosphate aldolase